MLVVDRLSQQPIYEQVIAQFKRMIMLGLLHADDCLPSVRSLSKELSINPNTLQKAYAYLENQGICYSVPGTGRFISQEALSIIQSDQRKRLTDLSQLTGELALAGISLNEIVQCVKETYHEYKVNKEEAHDDQRK